MLGNGMDRPGLVGLEGTQVQYVHFCPEGTFECWDASSYKQSGWVGLARYIHPLLVQIFIYIYSSQVRCARWCEVTMVEVTKYT